MSLVVSESTATKLKALLAREAGRLTATATVPSPEPPKTNWQFIRIVGEGFTGDDGFTYYPGQVEIWYATSSESVVYGDVWVKNWNPDALSLNRVYICRQSGNFIPGNGASGSGSGSGSGTTAPADAGLVKMLFLTADGSGEVFDGSGSGSGSGGNGCENTNEVTFRECDPATGEQRDVTITFPSNVRVCRTPVSSGG